MITAVADTHAIVWYFYANKRLSNVAQKQFDDTISAGNQIAVSSISLVEILFLADRSRIQEEAFEGILQIIASVDSGLVEVPLNSAIVKTMKDVEREDIPELPDRIIAATAFHLNVPLITRDLQIWSSSIEVIW